MKKIIVLAIIIVATMITTRTAEASPTDKEVILKEAVEQLAVSNEATVYYIGGAYIIPSDIVEYACTHEDDPDNLYDGSIIELRGDVETENIHGCLHAFIDRGFEIDEAEELTDRMVSEISAGLKDNATDREKMAAICDYMAQTYSYDKEALKQIEEKDDNSLRENFVEAYYGDRKIMCSEYATVTYILARKMGIECDVIRGSKHAYNIVKFADSDHWIGYDLTGGDRYAQLSTEWDISDSMHNPEGVMKDETASEEDRELAETAITLNNGKCYELADKWDSICDLVYFVVKAHHYEDLVAHGHYLYFLATMDVALFALLGIRIISEISPVRVRSGKGKKNVSIHSRGMKGGRR